MKWAVRIILCVPCHLIVCHLIFWPKDTFSFSPIRADPKVTTPSKLCRPQEYLCLPSPLRTNTLKRAVYHFPPSCYKRAPKSHWVSFRLRAQYHTVPLKCLLNVLPLCFRSWHESLETQAGRKISMADTTLHSKQPLAFEYG